MSRRHYITALIVILLTALLLAGCKPQTPNGLPARIEVYGSARTAETIRFRHQGHGQNLNNVELPWHYDFEIDLDDVVSLYATSDDAGSLRCRLLVTHQGVSSTVSSDFAPSGRFKSVSCGGRWIGFRYE